jgi:hypothetical protein
LLSFAIQVLVGRLQFWDVEKGETFLYLYSFGPEAWLALLPDGPAHGITLSWFF